MSAHTAAGFNLSIDAAAFKPLIDMIVTETVLRLESERAMVNCKMACTEPEAACLLSLKPHQLRDERRRGRIHASIGPGHKILYSRDDLTRYLSSRRWQGA
jgi:hypothetical protein